MASLSSSSKLAWHWCFEALADFKPVDTALLRDLTTRVPELSDQLSEAARERVALRCLEQWLSVNSSSDGRVASLTSDGRVASFEAIDVVPERRSCNEVLRLVLNKTKVSEMLKQEVHEFILHKRESLPGCALKQLKDAILDGTHPLSASMWKRNGLAEENQNRTIIHAGEGDPTEPARMNFTSDNEIQAPVEKSVHPLSQKNGKELLPVGQDSNGSRLDQENQSKSITPTVGSQSLEPVMIHNNTGDNEIEAPPEKLIYLVSVGNGKELLQDQPSDGNTESAQCGMANGKPVGTHLCLHNDHQVDGSHPSCLTDRGQQRSNLKSETVIHESGNETLKGDPPDTITKSTKRGRRGLFKEPQLNCLGKSRIHAEFDQLAYAKIAKYAYKQSIVHKLVLSHKDKHEQVDPPGRTISLPGNCILTNETQRQGLEGAEICAIGKEFLPLKRHKKGIIDCEIQHSMSWNDKIPITSSQLVSQREKFSDNAEDNNEICVSHPNGSKKNVSNETEDRRKRCDETEPSSKNDGHSDRTLSFDLTNVTLIAEEKQRFLNSQSTYDHDSQATSSQKALRICCKCGKGGQLLICSVNSCQFVCHESCLGPSSGFDDKGNFYCPFCSCERAITAYLLSKKKAALARKCFATFIGAGKSYQQQSNSGSTSQEPPSRKTTDVDQPDKNHDHGEQKRIVSNQLMLSVEHQKEAEDSGKLLDVYISCTEAEASIGSERNLIVLIGENPKPVDNQPTKGVREDEQPKEPLNACCNDDLPLREEKTLAITETPSVSLATERGSANMPEEPQPIGGEKEKKKQEFACNEDISCTRTLLVSHKPAEHENLEPVSQKQTVNPLPEPSSQPNVTAKETSETDIVSSDDSSRCSETDHVSSDDSIRSQRPSIRRLFPVLSPRRKKVPWTDEEEEILVEGVRRFSSIDNRNVPWKGILEFGCHVFQKSRNPVDLKDKWRNICNKGDPRARWK